MLFSLSHTLSSSFFCFLIVFLFLLLLPNSPIHSSPRGGEAWLSTEAELSKLHGSAKEKRRKQKWAKKPRGKAAWFLCLCVYWWGKYNCHISPCWATSSRINIRIMQLLTVDKNYTGRDKSRGRRHRGADWKWKQDWRDPKGQDVWIYVTGKCEGMKVWGDGSLVFHNCGICAGQ